MTEAIKVLSRRMMLWAATMAALFAARPAQAAASQRDIDVMLDGFVVTELSKRFGVLCTRLGAPEREKTEQAKTDFADAVDVIYAARQQAHDVLQRHHQKGQ